MQEGEVSKGSHDDGKDSGGEEGTHDDALVCDKNKGARHRVSDAGYERGL